MEEEKPLTKEDLLFQRDEKNEFIPKKVFIETIKKYVVIVPVPRGKWKTIQSAKSDDGIDWDAKVVAEHCIDPKVSYEELVASGRPVHIMAIANEIMRYSGLVRSKGDDAKKKVIPTQLEKTKEN